MYSVLDLGECSALASEIRRELCVWRRTVIADGALKINAYWVFDFVFSSAFVTQTKNVAFIIIHVTSPAERLCRLYRLIKILFPAARTPLFPVSPVQFASLSWPLDTTCIFEHLTLTRTK